ncbi:site-specific integrase [Flavobacterium dauae]|uniref:site-specific integrase n=1 Tax=Flavobacterium dauae TaxID=1563479 RepID=UPI00101C676C|nr:site-specific integrase [Flavobacterium dauae]WLD24282.1 site-specific integrase [Flavobacterium dauae]
MRTMNTFGIHFVIRVTKQQKNEMGAVFARVTVNSRKTEISLKAKVLPKNWDMAIGKAKGRNLDVIKLNNHIERVRSLITDCYHQLIQQRQQVTVEAVKSLYLGEDKEEGMTLIKLSEYHKQVETGRLAPGTLKNYTTTVSYLQRFIRKQYKKEDVYLEKLNYKFMLDFENFLHSHKPTDHQRPMNNNGVMKHLERLKKLANMAVTMDWLEKDPFSKYKLRFEKVERGHLSKEELVVLEKKNFSIERLQSVLDMFLFSCYTGLAYVDISKLSREHICKGIDGKDWLMTKREKTNTLVKVPLLPQAVQLISKYKNHPAAVANETLFPVVTNQRMNGYLKEIADICKIKKNLTFNLARHTFATTVTLSNGVPIESVSKMLGHTSIRTTQIYAKVVEHKLSEDMQNLKLKMASSQR